MDLGTAYGLAFSSGINAYLPLLALAIAARLWPDNFSINAHLAFITQPWCIVVLIILTFADFFADKIPVVDHIWDTIHTVIRPITGAMVAAAASSHVTGIALPLTLVLGGGIATLTHVTKATTRVASTATTGGLLNVVLSIGEDCIVVFSILLSLFLPHVMIAIVILFVIAFLCLVPYLIRTLWQRWQQTHASPATAATVKNPYPGP